MSCPQARGQHSLQSSSVPASPGSLVCLDSGKTDTGFSVFNNKMPIQPILCWNRYKTQVSKENPNWLPEQNPNRLRAQISSRPPLVYLVLCCVTETSPMFKTNLQNVLYSVCFFLIRPKRPKGFQTFQHGGEAMNFGTSANQTTGIYSISCWLVNQKTGIENTNYLNLIQNIWMNKNISLNQYTEIDMYLIDNTFSTLPGLNITLFIQEIIRW